MTEYGAARQTPAASSPSCGRNLPSRAEAVGGGARPPSDVTTADRDGARRPLVLGRYRLRRAARRGRLRRRLAARTTSGWTAKVAVKRIPRRRRRPAERAPSARRSRPRGCAPGDRRALRGRRATRTPSTWSPSWSTGRTLARADRRGRAVRPRRRCGSASRCATRSPTPTRAASSTATSSRERDRARAPRRRRGRRRS